MHYFMTILILSQAGAAQNETSIAHSYEVLIRETLLQTNGKVRPSVEKGRREEFRKRLAAFLEHSIHAGTASSAADWLALADCCDKLDMRSEAISYAKRARDCAQGVEPHIALVRLLCKSNSMAELEEAIAAASKEFQDDPKCYVLHNIAALKYQSLGQHSSAYAHFQVTVNMIARHVSSGDFFVGHFARCVDQWLVCGRNAGISSERRAAALELLFANCLASSCRHQDEVTVAARSNDNTATIESYDELRRTMEAMLIIDTWSGNRRAAAIFESWSEAILLLSKKQETAPQFFEEINHVFTDLMKSISPELDCQRVLTVLAKVDGEIQASPHFGPSGAEQNMRRAQCRQRVTFAMSTLRQHERLQALVGTRLLESPTLKAIANEDADAPILLHVCGSSAKAIDSDREVLDLLARESRTKRSDVQLCIAIALRESSSFAELTELRAKRANDLVGRFRSRVPFAGNVIHFDGLSYELSLLRPVVLPITVLCDKDGVVRGILTGAHRENVVRLLHMVSPQ